jgi:hypothetical protein
MTESALLNFLTWFNKLEELDLKWSTQEWLLQIIVKTCKEVIVLQLEEGNQEWITIKVLPDSMAIIFHHSELDLCKERDNQNKMEEHPRETE